MKEININQEENPQSEIPTTPVEMKKKLKIKIPDNKLVIAAFVMGFILLIGIISFFYFGIYKYNPKAPEDNIVNVSTNYVKSLLELTKLEKLLIDQPSEPRTEESPLNGLLFTKSEIAGLQDRRPVAVMVNNHSQARPQSGLNSADIVFETLVESGITRYLAIFWSQAPAKVGPMRSVRNYHLEMLSPYDALLLHDGCAQDLTNPKVNACGNLYEYGIKDLATTGAWRWNDGRRYAPHNEYTSVENAWDYAKKLSWDSFPSTFESWKFKNDLPLDQRGDGATYDIRFHQVLSNGNLYDTLWKYDKTSNTYLRRVGNQLDIDQENNTQVYAKVVIVQETTMTPTYNDKAHIIIETIGSGNATILQDGNAVKATWKKTTRTDRTTYYDMAGNEIELNRGRIWVSIVPLSVGKFAIIEQ